MGPRLLLVEDDDSIAGSLERALTREGYEVERLAEGEPAIDRARHGIDLVVLDLGLPDLDGLEVCRRLREAGSDVAILMLTARGDELDRVVGLDVGADDYLAKPFGAAELLARIRALLRRRPAAAGTAEAATGAPVAPGAPARTVAGLLRVHEQSRRVWVGEQEVALTPKEFDLLALLCRETGNVVSRERLMEEVWDEHWFGSTKTLDVTVARLRQKLGAAGAAVVTVRGVGLRLEPGDDA
jgi:DNA-binding response OmpR family regulator